MLNSFLFEYNYDRALAGLRVLVVGLSGAEDLLAAHAYAESLIRDYAPAEVVVAGMDDVATPAECLTFRAPGIYGVTGPAMKQDKRLVRAAAALPQGARGSPWVLAVPEAQWPESAVAAFQPLPPELESVVQSLVAEAFDVVISVDVGGKFMRSSLTAASGYSQTEIPAPNALRVLDRLHWSSMGLPRWIHLVLAPGLCGEISCDRIKEVAEGVIQTPLCQVHRGEFPLSRSFITALRRQLRHVLRYSPLWLLLEVQRGGTDDDPIEIPFGGQSPVVPRGWLRRGVAYEPGI